MAKKNIFCPRCGKPLSVEESDKQVFCMHCGNRIDLSIPEAENNTVEINTIDSVSAKEAQVQEQLSKSPATDEVLIDTQKSSAEEGEEASKPNAPNPWVAMIQTQRELAAEQIKKAEEQVAEQRKRENMSASKVGVLYSEATEEEKQAQKTLTFGDYLTKEWGFTNSLGIFIIISFILFAFGVIFLSAVRGTLVLGLICSLGIIGIIFFMILRGFFPRRCRKCKTDLNIADVNYEMVKTEMTNQGKRKATFRFNVKCPKCGTQKVFERTVFEHAGRYDIRDAAGRKMWTEGNDNQATWKEKIVGVGTILLFALAGLVCLIIGIVTLIGREEAVVPDDYYGTYVVTSVPSESYYYMLEEDNFSITLTSSNAIISGASAGSYSGEYSYEYVPVKNVDSYVPYISNPRYTDKDIIIIYWDKSDDLGMILFVVEKEPYTIELKNGVRLQNKTAMSAQSASGSSSNNGSLSNGQNSLSGGSGNTSLAKSIVNAYSGTYGVTEINTSGSYKRNVVNSLMLEIAEDKLTLTLYGEDYEDEYDEEVGKTTIRQNYIFLEEEDFQVYLDHPLSADYALYIPNFNGDNASLVVYLLPHGSIKMKMTSTAPKWAFLTSGIFKLTEISETFTITGITVAKYSTYSDIDVSAEQSECDQIIGQKVFLYDNGECCFLPQKTVVFRWSFYQNTYHFEGNGGSVCYGSFTNDIMSLHCNSDDRKYTYYFTFSLD